VRPAVLSHPSWKAIRMARCNLLALVISDPGQHLGLQWHLMDSAQLISKRTQIGQQENKPMFLGLGIVLLLLWLGGFFVFHVTAFFIHILLILAVISVVFHFMRGAASAV
jgi:Family of unknown function (DUF5670)